MVGVVVLDNSVLIPLFASDEDAAYSEKVFESAASGARLVAPALCLYEFGNALQTCVRRDRLTLGEAWIALERLAELPIEFGEGPSFLEVTAIHGLALDSGLTFYDGAYLMLAMCKNARLATLDKALCEAARKKGVAVFG